jgi:hypothetical protein
LSCGVSMRYAGGLKLVPAVSATTIGVCDLRA